jgi:hypothetical protein
MKIELWLKEAGQPYSRERMIEVDLPSIPIKGDIIMIGDDEGYHVMQVVYRLDSEGRFMGRICVDATSSPAQET